MPLLLLVLFVVVPIVEIYVIVQVGQAIGVLPTIGLLVADAVLGTWLFRREGRKAWAALRQTIGEHRLPAKEVADGALIVLGGALMLAPGFVTDGVGLLCVFPPTRAFLRKALTGVVARRLLVAPPSGGGRRGGRNGHEGPEGPGVTGVIDGEVVDE